MLTISAFMHFVDGLKAVHRRRHTERLLRELPPRIRSDIGVEELPPLPRRVRF